MYVVRTYLHIHITHTIFHICTPILGLPSICFFVPKACRWPCGKSLELGFALRWGAARAFGFPKEQLNKGVSGLDPPPPAPRKSKLRGFLLVPLEANQKGFCKKTTGDSIASSKLRGTLTFLLRGPHPQNINAFCLDVRTLTFCQLTGFPLNH